MGDSPTDRNQAGSTQNSANIQSYPYNYLNQNVNNYNHPNNWNNYQYQHQNFNNYGYYQNQQFDQNTANFMPNQQSFNYNRYNNRQNNPNENRYNRYSQAQRCNNNGNNRNNYNNPNSNSNNNNQNNRYNNHKNNNGQNHNNNNNGNMNNFQNQNNGNNFNNKNNNFNNNNNNNNNYQMNKNKKKNKPQKIDKRDLPENNKYYCEVCDRGFKIEEKYNEHLATHETCHVPGCSFRAAAKLVELHFRNFHATGIDKKISKLQTQEDLQKYINERKKNFPTLSNLEKKTEFEKEKETRGVNLNTRQFGKANPSRKRNFSQMTNNANRDITDESVSFDKKSKTEETSGNERATLSNFNRNKNRRLAKNSNKKSLFQRKSQYLRAQSRKPTLLQRLLADEIRHERNMLLQCVKYVVENNFFEKKIVPLSNEKSENENQVELNSTIDSANNSLRIIVDAETSANPDCSNEVQQE